MNVPNNMNLCNDIRTPRLCSIMRLLNCKREFLNKAIKLHRHKYDYSCVEYSGISNKVKIICPKHGEFQQRAGSHLQGHGCDTCGVDRQSDKLRSNLMKFTARSNKIHNNKYDYSKFNYQSNKTNGEIICPIHGSFWQHPLTHLHGSGCPKCNTSKGELKIEQWLDKNNIIYETQKTFTDCRNPKTNGILKFDFYISSKNMLIEFDGKQHFKPGKTKNYVITNNNVKQIQYRDTIKTNYAKNKNITLVRIKYTRINSIDKILKNNI